MNANRLKNLLADPGIRPGQYKYRKMKGSTLENYYHPEMQGGDFLGFVGDVLGHSVDNIIHPKKGPARTGNFGTDFVNALKDGAINGPLPYAIKSAADHKIWEDIGKVVGLGMRMKPCPKHMGKLCKCPKAQRMLHYKKPTKKRGGRMYGGSNNPWIQFQHEYRQMHPRATFQEMSYAYRRM